MPPKLHLVCVDVNHEDEIGLLAGVFIGGLVTRDRLERSAVADVREVVVHEHRQVSEVLEWLLIGCVDGQPGLAAVELALELVGK